MSKKYQLTMVACILNEAPYLKEWIDFHLIIGFEHFYIYDTGTEPKPMKLNYPEYRQECILGLGWPEIAHLEEDGKYYLNLDNPKEVLQYYIDKGLVTYVEHPHFDQKIIYKKAVDDYGHDSKWMAFLDLDEFLYPTDPKLEITNILKDFEEYPGLGVNQLFFGSSGIEKYDTRPVLEKFVHRAKDDCGYDKYNDFIKTIAQPDQIFAFKNAHVCHYLNNKKAVNTKKKSIGTKSQSTPIHHELLRINHYHNKSKEEFLTRHTFGRHGKTASQNLSRFEAREAICNEVEDHLIQNNLKIIKKRKNKFI